MVGIEGAVVGDRHGGIRQRFNALPHLSRAGAKSKVLTADFCQHRAARRHMLTDHLFMEYNSVGNGPALTENYEHESQRMKIIR